MKQRYAVLAGWLAVWGCWALPVAAQRLAGRITDESGTPVPYATVAIEGTTLGVVASAEGVYALQLPAGGSYQLQVRSLGYQSVFLSVTLREGEELTRDFRLVAEDLVLSDVLLTDGDPATVIMRAAIRNRNRNDNAVRAYSVKSYSKLSGYNREKKKIEFLSETFSTLYVRKPNQRKEVIHNSRVSGDSRAYTGIGALLSVVNPYRNLVGFPQLFVREFVSPLADNAFFFYRFTYLGSFREKGHTVFKIKLEPRRPADPAFHGTVYIADESYAVQAFDWSIYGNQPIRYFDTLRCQQTFLPVRDSLWLPFRNTMYGAIRVNALVEKFDYTGSVLNVFSDYQISDPPPGRGEPKLTRPVPARMAQVPRRLSNRAKPRPAPPGSAPPDTSAAEAPPADLAAVLEGRRTAAADTFFDEIIRVEKKVTVENRNVAFWDSLRPVALSDSERVNFVKGDSLERRRSSKAYKDSLNRATNRLEWDDLLLTGYTYTNIENKNTFSVDPLLSSIQYNTMEGWVADLGLRKTYRFVRDTLNEEFDDRLRLSANLRYGLASERFLWRTAASYAFDHVNYRTLSLSLEDYVAEFSAPIQSISPFNNTIYSLFLEQNYLKLYRQQGARLFYGQRLGKDNTVNVALQAYRRQELPNRTQYVVRPRAEREFTPNIGLPTHYSAQAQVNLRVRFASRYMTLPTGRIYIPDTRYPSITFGAGAGRQWNDEGLSTNFQTLRARLEGQLDLKLLGELQYQARGGWMFRDGEVLLPDRFHVATTQIYFREDELNRFATLDYYDYNSQDGYAEGHVEHNFRGFWFNKLPLLRKLKLHEVVGVHVVDMSDRRTHTELALGLSNIRVFRIDLFRINWHTAVTGSYVGRSRFTIMAGIGL